MMRAGSRSFAFLPKKIRCHMFILASFLCLASLATTGAAIAEASRPVDLKLVIALDVSTSMDLAERKLQRDGFATAFRQPDVLRAIQRGPHQRIAVAVMEWAGETRQNVILDWTELADAPGIAAFADRLESRIPGRMALGTAVGAAMLRAAAMLRESPYGSDRLVINISGDGLSNRGPDPAAVRDLLVARGITINGLPIVYKDLLQGIAAFGTADAPGPGALIRYFEESVIGGAGAFVEPVASIDQFDEAIRRKLIREIHGPLDVAGRGDVDRPEAQAAVAASIVPDADSAIRMAATTWPIAARSSADGPPR